MKRPILFLLAGVLAGAAGLSTGCGGSEEEAEVFYSVTYPIVKIEAEVTISPENNPLEAQIAAEIEAGAPVRAGGSYRLDFFRHNGGNLTVDTATEAGTLTGVFVKDPSEVSPKIRFLYPDLYHGYTCEISSDTDEQGVRKIEFSVDLFEEYRARYPDAGLTQARRNELTGVDY